MSETTAFFRSLVQQQPHTAALHCHLAQALLADMDYVGAFDAACEAIGRDTRLVDAWLARATARVMQGQSLEAIEDFKLAAQLAPERAGILVSVANCYAEHDHLEAAEDWLRQAIRLEPGNKEAQANLGSVLIKLDRVAEAEKPCRAALALDGCLISPHQNLSAVLADSDPVAARYHRDRAYQRQQVFVELSWQEKHRILVLTAADAANVPLRYLMPQSCFTLVRWYVEYAAPGQANTLPPYDLVFNSIGEADFMPVMAIEAAALLKGLGKTLLNPPDRVSKTARDRLPHLLADVPDAMVPRTIRAELDGTDLSETFAEAAINLPLLVRPFGAHGGEGVVKADTLGGLAAMPAGGCYLTEFVDFGSPDRLYRKYRAIFVDGQAFPYHLAISPRWLVHYWTAGMDQDVRRREEERSFLADPAKAIGRRAWAAVEQIARRLELDYGGLDFGVLADGRVLVFEGNATMLVHPERDPMFAYRQPAVAAIQQAFATMIDGRAAETRATSKGFNRLSEASISGSHWRSGACDAPA